MSDLPPHLPPDILGHVADLLHDDLDTLKQCCLIPKLWVSLTRRHIFAHVTFRHRRDQRKWGATFPDPTNSPTCYTRTLTVYDGFKGTEEGSLVRGFSRVERLFMFLSGVDVDESFIPFHLLAPSLKSLSVTGIILFPHIFNLIRSLPLLEDLTLHGYDPPHIAKARASDPPITGISSTPPPFTGTFQLELSRGTAETPRLLLELPGGLHFQTLEMSCELDGCFRRMVEVVAACSGTLECLKITCTIVDGVLILSFR